MVMALYFLVRKVTQALRLSGELKISLFFVIFKIKGEGALKAAVV